MVQNAIAFRRNEAVDLRDARAGQLTVSKKKGLSNYELSGHNILPSKDLRELDDLPDRVRVSC